MRINRLIDQGTDGICLGEFESNWEGAAKVSVKNNSIVHERSRPIRNVYLSHEITNIKEVPVATWYARTSGLI